MKVKIISMVNNSVGVSIPESHFQRTWTSKGMAIPVEKEVLEDLMFDPGFKYMIDTGVLYIDDMQTKQDLGIEPEDAAEPVNIIALTDKDRKKYMISMPIDEFKEKIAKLSRIQVDELAGFAIKNKYADYEKCKLIKKYCGRDVIKGIELSEANQA